MDYVSIILIILLCAYIFYKEKFGKKASEDEKSSDNRTDYKEVYRSKWLFTYNEKDFYKHLKEFAAKQDMSVFAKVRLYDLLEPRDSKDKFARYKIQAKHVDFVLCNSKLVAKYVIELDDQSHESANRKDRDAFVDEVLTACGYKVLHLRAYDEEALLKLVTE